MANLLRNGDFEVNWSEERSHDCLRIASGREPELIEVESIFTPPGWLVWFRVEDGEWARPEGELTVDLEPPRRRSGVQGYELKSLGVRLDAGLLQQVPVAPGTELRLGVWAHAWSNHDRPATGEDQAHANDPTWSVGAGRSAFFAPEGSLSGSTEENPLSNATFWVGIDPGGGRDPSADSVLWGSGAHIYNVFAEVPPVECRAGSDIVTVFLRARCAFPFKHNYVYWDDATLIAQKETGSGPARRGRPRIQYERYYVLLPPGANKEWASAAVEATWDDHRYTIGGSADDAGIGDLDSRIVLAVNPEQWGGPEVLRNFFSEHYPGVRYRSVQAQSPEELVRILEGS